MCAVAGARVVIEASILENLPTSDFVRIRMGVGRPPEGVETVDFVLGRFREDDQALASGLVARAAAAVEALCEHDLLSVMNQFNRDEAALTT